MGKKLLFLLFLSMAFSVAKPNDYIDEIGDMVKHHNRKSEVFKSMHHISKLNIEGRVICGGCNIIFGNIINKRRKGASQEEMKRYSMNLCSNLLRFGMTKCQEVFDVMLEPFLFIVDNRKNLTGRRVCSILLQQYGCKDPTSSKWEIPLPEMPENSKVHIPKSEVDTINILHLTDFHYDPLYKSGSDAVCSDLLCCSSGTPRKSKHAAGFWGDYRTCDIPVRTVENALHTIKEHHVNNIDYVYFTGDIMHHRFWNSTIELNSNAIKDLFDRFEYIFQGKTVYPVIGNHETHPADLYAPLEITQRKLSTKWLYELAADQWARWLPEHTKATILKGGYYTVMTKLGYRIIALNSNVCFVANLWLAFDDRDPYGQLAWLVDELSKAEKHNEKVHILSHIPPGERTCHRQWSKQYHRIVDRFSDTIAAEFNGHTHADEIRVFRNPENKKVKNIAFNGGSLTTYIGFNPNYKIYEVKVSTATVENYHQYIFNLTKANEGSKPEWFKQYSFKEAYDLPDMSPGSIEWLLDRLSCDRTLMKQYYRFYVKDSDVKIEEGCNKKCLKQRLCQITAVDADLAIDCF